MWKKEENNVTIGWLLQQKYLCLCILNKISRTLHLKYKVLCNIQYQNLSGSIDTIGSLVNFMQTLMKFLSCTPVTWSLYSCKFGLVKLGNNGFPWLWVLLDSHVSNSFLATLMSCGDIKEMRCLQFCSAAVCSNNGKDIHLNKIIHLCSLLSKTDRE